MERCALKFTPEQLEALRPMLERCRDSPDGTTIMGQVFQDGIYLRLTTPERTEGIRKVFGITYDVRVGSVDTVLKITEGVAAGKTVEEVIGQPLAE